MTNNPTDVLNGGGQMPLGGAEETSMWWLKSCWCSTYVLIVLNNHYHINSSYCILVYIVYVGGYKGSGLGVLVEIFCGILSGSAYGPNIRRWKNTTTVANLVCTNLLSADVCGGLSY